MTNDPRGWLILEIIKNDKGDVKMYAKKSTQTSKIQWECSQRMFIILDTGYAYTLHHLKI